MKILFFILSLTYITTTFSSEEAAATLNFFFDSSLTPKIGLSCSNESECKNKCANNETCQKSVSTCLSCIGAKSPFLNDFFNNVGELTTSCLDQGFLSSQAEALFNNVSMVPIFPISPYNPLGLKDIGLMIKFMTLCPAGTREPTIIGFTDPTTHAIIEIPMVKCGDSLFPLVRFGEDCAKKADQILTYINQRQEKNAVMQSAFQNTAAASESLPLKYDVLQYSDYTEAQYIGCAETSKLICQNICHSSLSCAIPLNNEVTAKGIAVFNKEQFTDCGMERFSIETLASYLKANDSFAFNSLSLAQSFDLPTNTGDFKDLSVINSILNIYAGIFKTTEKMEDSSFFISDLYQKRIEAKMKNFCDPSSSPFVLGHNGQVERVFCKSGLNGYFKILANPGESCSDKTGKLSVSSIGGTNE